MMYGENSLFMHKTQAILMSTQNVSVGAEMRTNINNFV